MKKNHSIDVEAAVSIGLVTGLILGGYLGSAAEKIRAWHEYQERAKVSYQGIIYDLKDLYQLTKQDESVFCILDSDIYYDLDDGNVVSVKGYEEAFGYDVIDLKQFFTLEECQDMVNERAIQEKFDIIVSESVPKTNTK